MTISKPDVTSVTNAQVASRANQEVEVLLRVLDDQRMRIVDGDDLQIFIASIIRRLDRLNGVLFDAAGAPPHEPAAQEAIDDTIAL